MDRIRIGNIATITRGVSYKKDQANKEKKQDSIALLRANNIDDFKFNYNDLVFISNSLVSEKQHIKCGDIIISMSSGSKNHVGKVAIAKSDMSCTYGAFCAKITPAHILPDYLFYVLRSGYFRKHIESCSKGTNINNLKREYILDFEIPLPSEQEQQRIVTRIEELFSELDSAVETLQKTKQQLEVYRQAVLKEAFSFESSELVEIQTIVDDIRIGPFGTMLHKSDYITDGVPVINPQHIKNGTIVHNNSNTISVEKAAELSNYRLIKNDIIMGRRGEMGRAAPITDKEDGWLCGTGSLLFRLKPEFDAALYAKILSSPDVVHYLEDNATGTTMKNLNEAIVKHIPVPYITTEMQKRIVNSIDAKMSVCDSIEKTIEESLQQAEAMRQSILKKAFEGRL